MGGTAILDHLAIHISEFEDEEDRQAYIADNKLDSTRGNYITYSATPDDLFDDDDYSVFLPEILE